MPAILLAGLIALLVGCSPPGPGALLQGEALLRKNKPAEAVEQLKLATELMRDEPRAYNLLGLAYHRVGQPQLAAQAYRQALARDRSNLVAVAHYNLGCLLLEQGNAAGAADELRSYTLTTNSVAGWVKLGAAQLRLRQFTSAETSLVAAQRLEPRNPEVLNTIGVLHAQRNQRDAAQFFASALQASPQYAPAMLNAALIAQQNPASKPAALQRFREYLALHPRSPQADAVKAMVRQLESDLAPPRTAALPTNALAPTGNLSKTNLVSIATPVTNVVLTTSAPPRVASVVRTNPVVLPPQTNLVAATATNIPAPVKIPVTVVIVTNQPPKIAAAEPIAIAPEKTSVPLKPIIEPAETSIPPADPKFETPGESPKPGFFSRLNPFRGKPTSPTNSPLIAEPSRTIAASESSNVAPASKPVFPRYAYTVKNRPASGNRAESDRAMQQAMKAQRAANTNEALLDYQLAVQADPGYFDAQYNSALLAFLAGDLKRALSGYETALAIEPESINARYNFALALKQGGYANDAVDELQRVLEAKPNEARAHQTLANLFAQQLEDVDRARPHYFKVIELDPRNPQSAAIRFWLAAHP